MLDCDDSDPLVIGPPPCPADDPPTPDPLGSPIIALVSNKFHTGSAVGHIAVRRLSAIYTNVSLRDFNRQDAQWLRNRSDVLHIQWSTPSSLQVSWEKLRLFMNAEPVPCGGMDERPCQGGSILFEDPQNVLELEVDGLFVSGVEHHATTDSVIVAFEPSPEDANFPGMYDQPEEILSAFTALKPDGITPFNRDGYFLPGVDATVCLLDELPNNPFPGTIQTLGLGHGCLNNNHMTFKDVPGLGLIPFLRLVGAPEDLNVVGLYGMGNGTADPVNWEQGRILFTGPDSVAHTVFVASPFHSNYFCLLTNELIFLLQAYLTPVQIEAARDNCVEYADVYRREQGQLGTNYP
jgi:hypothetical protein